MHLSCANGVAVVSNEIKTNGGTTQDGDEEGKGSEVREVSGGEARGKGECDSSGNVSLIWRSLRLDSTWLSSSL